MLEFRSGPRCTSCCWQLSACLCWRPFASRPPHPITSPCLHPLCLPQWLQRRVDSSRPCAEPSVPWATREPARWKSWSCLDGAREQQAAAGFAGRSGWVWVCGGLALAPPHLGVPDSFPLRGAESREVTPRARSAPRALLGPAKPLPLRVTALGFWLHWWVSCAVPQACPTRCFKSPAPREAQGAARRRSRPFILWAAHGSVWATAPLEKESIFGSRQQSVNGSWLWAPRLLGCNWEGVEGEVSSSSCALLTACERPRLCGHAAPRCPWLSLRAPGCPSVPLGVPGCPLVSLSAPGPRQALEPSRVPGCGWEARRSSIPAASPPGSPAPGAVSPSPRGDFSAGPWLLLPSAAPQRWAVK